MLDEKDIKSIKANAQMDDQDAQYRLGECYQYGYDVELSYSKAAYWYSKAAKNCLPAAQYKLGVCYLLGQGVKQNLKKAKYWFKQAVGQGYTEAKSALAFCFFEGVGTKRNDGIGMALIQSIILDAAMRLKEKEAALNMKDED